MFSEYASKFLAQSASRITFTTPTQDPSSSIHSDRHSSRYTRPPRTASSSNKRSYLTRAAGPYASSFSQHLPHLPFASRTSQAPAPLFYSAQEDDIEEEDEEEEHAREIADFYALQRSRRQFAGGSMMSKGKGRGARDAIDEEEEEEDEGGGSAKGKQPSWRVPVGARPGSSAKGKENQRVNGGDADGEANPMVDVKLEDTVVEDERDPELALSMGGSERHDDDESLPPGGFDKEPLLQHGWRAASTAYRPTASMQMSVPDPEPSPPPQYHDRFWAHLFLLSLGSLLATSLLIYLHTTSTPRGPILGDTIYTTLHASFFPLATYTLLSISLSLLWLALLRSYLRFLVYAMLAAVPVILYAASIYALVSSFSGDWAGRSLQDKCMRWLALVPATVATLWTYIVIIRSRHATARAIDVLDFAARILAANPALILLGFATLFATVVWSWLWLLMFTRVFLTGHFTTGMGKRFFTLDVSAYWLAAFFALTHAWTLAVLSGLQRSITAATVSQWYFHRHDTAARGVTTTVTSINLLPAATAHCLGPHFGTIALSSLLSLLLRLPFLLLPARATALLSLAAYTCAPAPLPHLASPLCLSLAAIHGYPLSAAAQALAQLTFLPALGGGGLGVGGVGGGGCGDWRGCGGASGVNRGGYARRGRRGRLEQVRLAKVVLYAMRACLGVGVGFGGWVFAAREISVPSQTQAGLGVDVEVEAGTKRGSLYAYVVGLVGAAIGWCVLGAMEGVLGAVVDAVLVCWAVEVGTEGRQALRCREADRLFGGVGAGAGGKGWGGYSRLQGDGDGGGSVRGAESEVWDRF